MKDRLNQVFNDMPSITSAMVSCAIVAALTLSFSASAEKSDIYFNLGLVGYNGNDWDYYETQLRDEFPAHTIFRGRECRRYCDTPGNGSEHTTGGFLLGIGYNLTERLTGDLSIMTGSDLNSTVVQAGNPIWYSVKQELDVIKANLAMSFPVTPQFAIQAGAGVQLNSLRLRYATTTGDGHAEDTIDATNTKSHDVAAHLTGGFWWTVQEQYKIGLQLSHPFSDNDAYTSSIEIQWRILPWKRTSQLRAGGRSSSKSNTPIERVIASKDR